MWKSPPWLGYCRGRLQRGSSLLESCKNDFWEGSLGATRVCATVIAVTGGFSNIRDDKRGEQAPAGRQSGWVLGAVREQTCTNPSQLPGEHSTGTSRSLLVSYEFCKFQPRKVSERRTKENLHPC